MQMETKNGLIVTRFPPSPTGFLHVGNARTAIFNWLYARRMKGKFVLRIEDTDMERSTQQAMDAIFEALEWLGIDWDEGPFYQTQRLDIYHQYLQRLIDSGHAYYCTCSPDAITAMREKAMATGGKPKYDGTCREKGLNKTADAVVLDVGRGMPGGAAHQGVQTRQQFLFLKGFGQVVVGTLLQALDLFLPGIPCRENQDGSLHMCAPPVGQYLEA